MNALEEGGKAVTAVADAMKNAPLALALLIINAAFIGFVAYLLSEVSENARERNTAQIELINRVLRECSSANNRSKSSIIFRSSKGREAPPAFTLPDGDNSGKPKSAKDDKKN